jgi:hypothetical protein
MSSLLDLGRTMTRPRQSTSSLHCSAFGSEDQIASALVCNTLSRHVHSKHEREEKGETAKAMQMTWYRIRQRQVLLLQDNQARRQPAHASDVCKPSYGLRCPHQQAQLDFQRFVIALRVDDPNPALTPWAGHERVLGETLK